MPRKPVTLVSTLLAFALASGAHAQTQATRDATGRAPQSATKPRANAKSDAAKSDAASRAKRERREAVAALRELAEAARSFEYPFDKVRIQTEVADTLWPFDEQSARAILRRAWEVTTAPGADDAFETEDDPRFGSLDYILAARETVITRAAKHDARLAESFLHENARDLASRGEAAREAAGLGDEPAGPHDVWRHPSEQGRQRLSTASALINIGAYKSAADFASPVIAEGASRPLLNFILRLRAFDPRAADNFYLRLLERTRLDADADANDVLLLSTPVISPELLVSIGADGSTYFMNYQDGVPGEEPPPISVGVRRAFLDTAAAVLLRAAAPRSQATDADAFALASYFAIGRLLPFFDREAPQHAPLLRARMAALSQQIEEARRNAASNLMETRSLKPKNPTDPLNFEIEEIKRAASEAERDRWRMAAVSLAADKKLWHRARQLADDIGDAEIKHAALFIIAVRQVTNLLEAFEDEKADDDFERAAAFARAADVPPAARAIGLSQAAELAARKGKRARASALFGEALATASQASGSKELRVTTLALLADTATRLSEQSAWELLAQLVAAVNDAGDGADNGDDCAGVYVGYAGVADCISLARRVPEPDELFAKMASLDFERALTQARTLKDEVTRAEVLVAAARAVLLKKSAGQNAGAR